MAEKLIVTRYKGVAEYLKRKGYVEENTEILTRVQIEDVKGKHVFGVLPIWLAAHTARFTEVQLHLPDDLRGQKVGIKDIEFYMLPMRTFEIQEVENV